MRKEAITKDQLMAEEGVDSLSKVCRGCFGFSAWAGDKEATPYEERDCSECGNNPSIKIN